jgi:AraC-like DNA-binding protein
MTIEPPSSDTARKPGIILNGRPGNRWYLFDGWSVALIRGMNTRVRRQRVCLLALPTSPGTVSIRLRGQPWRAYSAVALRNSVAHEYAGGDASQILIGLEPDAPRVATIRSRLLGTAPMAPLDYAPLHDRVRRLTEVIRADLPVGTVRAEAERLLQMAAGNPFTSTPSEPRVARALEYIRGHLDHSLRTGEIAGSVGLSSSRLMHLFTDHADCSVRGSIKWIRLEQALRGVAHGMTFSQAARWAGFCDAAHLTRTFSEMWGLTPRQVFGSPASATRSTANAA